MSIGSCRAHLLFSLAIGALLLFLPLITLAVPQTGEWGEDSKRLALQVFAASLLLSMAALGGIRLGGFATGRAVPLVVFAVWLVVTAGLGRWPGQSLANLIPTLIGIGLCLAVQESSVSLRRVGRWWIWASAAAVLAAFLAFDPWNLLDWAIEGQSDRYAMSSTFANPLSLAGFLAPVCCFAMARLIAHPRPSPLLGFVAVAALGLWLVTILMTASRGPTLAVALGIMVTAVIVLGRRAVAPRSLLIVLGCVLGMLAVHFALGLRSPARPLLDRTGQGVLRSESIHHRVTLWTLGGQMIRRAPVMGHGWGSYPMLFQEQLLLNLEDDPDGLWELEAHSLNGRVARHVHCDYLELMVSGGVPALALFLWILVESVGLALGSSERVRWPMAGAAGAVTCLAVLAVVDFPLQRIAHAVLLWVALGVCRRRNQPLV